MMRKIDIAFDVDGTLRKNSEEIHRTKIVPNLRIIRLMETLDSFKNVRLHVWSNRGAEYCWEIVQRFDLPVKQKNCRQKTWLKQNPDFVPDVAIDDQQRFDGGMLNLIVREK